MEAEPPIAATPKPKRRCFQFSLRTMLIAEGVLAILAGVVGLRVAWYLDEVQVEQAKLGQLHDEFGGSAQLEERCPAAIRPIVTVLFDDDRRKRVKSVSLSDDGGSGDPDTRKLIDCLRGFRYLECVTVGHRKRPVQAGARFIDCDKLQDELPGVIVVQLNL